MGQGAYGRHPQDRSRADHSCAELMRTPFFPTASTAFAALLLTCAASLAQSTTEQIAKGDAFDKRYQAAEALELYLPVEKAEPNNVAVLLRIARQYRHLMTDAPKREDKLRLGAKALDYAQRAAALAPNNSEAQLSVAITYGKMTPFKSSKEQLEGSRRIKEGAERAMKLDPRNDLAWHIYGRWHLNMAEISPVKRAVANLVYGKVPAASYTDAERAFERAIAINPDRLMHHVELGRTYAQMGRKAEARTLIAKGLAMPSVEKDDPETKKRGREILAKLR